MDVARDPPGYVHEYGESSAIRTGALYGEQQGDRKIALTENPACDEAIFAGGQRARAAIIDG